MTTSILDAHAATGTSRGSVATLGGLHDEAGKVDEALLPCRVNDPELWFAESPADVEFAKALCQACPVRAAVPRRRTRPARAVGRLGR